MIEAVQEGEGLFAPETREDLDAKILANLKQAPKLEAFECMNPGAIGLMDAP